MNDPRVEIAKIAHRAKVEWIDRHSRDDYGNEDYLAMADALKAADAADREQGIHRVKVDNATVERVARAIGERFGFDIVSPDAARAVLAALTGSES